MLPPARILLQPGYEARPAWALFDAQWYVSRYAPAHFSGAGEADILAYYLESGAQRGHSPSPLFDEAFYLAEYPDAAELVRAGAYDSGFDHFCQHGHLAACPHFLFDDRSYGRLYEDMSLENLDQHGFYGRYDHYLKTGQHEGRIGHFIFDPAFYRARAIAAGEAPEAIDAAGPYTHYLYRLSTARPELPPSIYFDPAWYLANGFDAKQDIARGRHHCAIEHYLCADPSLPRDPVPEFSEAFYRRTYSDIGDAIADGYFRSGYQHFVQYGAFELRRPRHDINLLHYRDANPSVRDDLNTGAMRDAFAHLRAIGLRENFDYDAPDKVITVNEEMAKQLFILKSQNNLARFARRRLDFTGPAPEISVIMVLYNKFELTMLALASLRDHFAGAIELILVDNGSKDDTKFLEACITGAKILRLKENLGFTGAANLALAQVTAPAVLYLNNDIELAAGAVDVALARLRSAADIGAVGGKIIRSLGILQEAGSIIWRDGNTSGYMRDASPLCGEANFVRDVDFCSAVFLLCRADLVKTLNGFDEDFRPAYYEDTDLCVRMRQSGARIVYDPAITVHHLEFGSASHSSNSISLMRRGLKVFAGKHRMFLQGQYDSSPENLVLARSAGPPRPRVLYIDDTVPLRRLGSGFVRANDILHGIASSGHDVTVFPVNGAPYDIMSILGDFSDNVEILHDRNLNMLTKFLTARKNYYNLVWVSRTHNLARIMPAFEAAGISLPIILDTEALAASRGAAKAELNGIDFDLTTELRAEFTGTKICARILAVNQAEAALLSGIGAAPLAVLGTARKPDLTPNEFSARSGLLFAAAIHQQDSPALDSLSWYMNEILPALQNEMAAPPVLHVAGYAAETIDLTAFSQTEFIQLHGAVSDLRPFYNACRVFIAPTRFAAGTPYKIYEAAAQGLPCVVTDLLATQLGWRKDEDLLAEPVTDSKRFAAAIARLYRDEPLWDRLRAQAAARLAAENTQESFNRIIYETLTSF